MTDIKKMTELQLLVELNRVQIGIQTLNGEQQMINQEIAARIEEAKHNGIERQLPKVPAEQKK